MKQYCENCKHSFQFGNPIWSKSELRCEKQYDISLVNLDRSVNKKDCKDYELDYYKKEILELNKLM